LAEISNIIENINLKTPDGDLHVVVKLSNRSKSIRLKITPARQIELIIPNKSWLERAKKFLAQKEKWLLSKLNEMPKECEDIILDIGAEVSILGKNYVVKHSGNAHGKAHLSENELIISGRIEMVPARVRRFLKGLLVEESLSYIKQISQELKVMVKKLTIKNMTSRWGSCSTSGNISLSWHLVFAPREVLHYVLVHELCHLLEHNHGKRFWTLVEGLCPSYKIHVYWLKKNGKFLHLYR